MEIKELSPEALIFVREHREHLNHVVDEIEWMEKNLIPLMKKDGVFGRGWYLRVSFERYERVEENQHTSVLPIEVIEG